jgi:prohead serine protease
MSEREYKTFFGELKTDGAGALVATFSRFAVVDHDGDVTLKSAIEDGAEVVLGSYNHSSVSGSALPIGKGVIRNDGTRAQIVADIFDTPAARAEYQTIKGLGDLAEYSYSFRVLEQSTDADELSDYPGARRILKALDVIEACAVIRGAGIGTGTDSAKRGTLTLADLGFTPEFLNETARTLRESARALGHFTLADLDMDEDFIESLRTAQASRFMRI